MSKIAILTDSSCDIPQELAEKYGIDIMGFHILLDDEDIVEREKCHAPHIAKAPLLNNRQLAAINFSQAE